MSLHRITITAVVELPDDDIKQDLYGTVDPAECVQIDFDNDPPLFLLEQADEMEIVEVTDL
jgi:hypothetical protein